MESTDFRVSEEPWTLLIRDIEAYPSADILAGRMALDIRMHQMMAASRLDWYEGIVFSAMSIPPSENTPMGILEVLVRWAPMKDYTPSLKSNGIEIPVLETYSPGYQAIARYIAANSTKTEPVAVSLPGTR